MKYDRNCPVCGRHAWRILGSRVYRKVDSSFLSDYVRQRYRVLFEVWFAGASEVIVTSRLCTSCGFLTLTPRPDGADLDAKYRFLGHEGDGGELAADVRLEHTRAKELYRAVSRLSGRRPFQMRVLDFGGGDGRLMRQFVSARCECHLVDYSQKCVADVLKLADTIDQVPVTERYDLVICSHVLEHLAEPLQLTSSLTTRLESEGLLYVEVPMEIWGRPPLPQEPVTHINFFTPSSLRYLLAQAGLRTRKMELGTFRHPTGRRLLAVRAVAERSDAPLPEGPPGCEDVERFLEPGLREKVWRFLMLPENIGPALLYRVSGWLWATR